MGVYFFFFNANQRAVARQGSTASTLSMITEIAGVLSFCSRIVIVVGHIKGGVDGAKQIQ